MKKKFKNIIGKIDEVLLLEDYLGLWVINHNGNRIKLDIRKNPTIPFQSNTDIFQEGKLKKGNNIIVVVSQKGLPIAYLVWNRDWIGVEEYRGVMAYIEDTTPSNIDVNYQVDYYRGKDIIFFPKTKIERVD
jgi:hypothetical protein